MSCHCSISTWRESPRTEISTLLKGCLKVAVFANIFQAIWLQLCPLLLFPFSSKTGDVSREPGGVGDGTFPWSWVRTTAGGWLSGGRGLGRSVLGSQSYKEGQP